METTKVKPEINKQAKAILGHFSISDEAQIIFNSGKGVPEGRLPFEMPTSPDTVD